MNKTSVITIIALVGAVVWLSLAKSCGNVSTHNNGHDSLLTEIRDLKQSVSDRDTLIDRSHDTVMYRVKVVTETIREYRTLHDTIMRLMACDSIVKHCEILAVECVRNDSIHTVQTSELKQIVTKQDTVIQFQASDIEHLKRKNRVLKIGGGLIGSVLVAALIVK